MEKQLGERKAILKEGQKSKSSDSDCGADIPEEIISTLSSQIEEQVSIFPACFVLFFNVLIKK